MLAFILIAIFCVTFLIKYNVDKRRLLKYVAHLPSAKSYPLIGCGFSFIGKNSKDIYRTLLEFTSTQSLTTFWLGSKLFLIVKDPVDVQTVLLSPNCLDKPKLYKFFPIPNSIFCSDVHVWKSNRKLLNPLFAMKMVMSHIPIFNEKSKLLVDTLPHKMLEKNFDVSKNIFACIMDTTCATFMKFESNILNDENKEYFEAMERLFPAIALRIMKFWLHPSFIYKLTRAYQTQKRIDASILRITNLAIAERQNPVLLNDRKTTNNISCEDTFNETKSVALDSLLKLADDGKITKDEVCDHIHTLLFGGIETSALVISHTILMLSIHPEYQDRLYEELKSYCNLDEDITYDTISKLQYLEMVIKETMRICPIAPVVGRNCLADTKISSCTIPKGTTIGIAVHHLHHNPDIWGTDADEFNPDHFLPDRIHDRHPFAYIPFSAGPRNCIGIKYGWMMMKVILAHLLLNFKFSTNMKMSEIKSRWYGVVKIINLHLVKMERRA